MVRKLSSRSNRISCGGRLLLYDLRVAIAVDSHISEAYFRLGCTCDVSGSPGRGDVTNPAPQTSNGADAPKDDDPAIAWFTHNRPESSPRRSQLDSGFVERGTLQFNRLRRAAVIAIFPWNAFLEPKPKTETAKKERRDPLKTARYYQSLLDTGKFENRAALARYLGVSRAMVTQVLGRLREHSVQ